MSLHLHSSVNAVSLPQHFVDIAPLYSGMEVVGEPDFLIFVGDLPFLLD